MVELGPQRAVLLKERGEGLGLALVEPQALRATSNQRRAIGSTMSRRIAEMPRFLSSAESWDTTGLRYTRRGGSDCTPS